LCHTSSLWEQPLEDLRYQSASSPWREITGIGEASGSQIAVTPSQLRGFERPYGGATGDALPAEDGRYGNGAHVPDSQRTAARSPGPYQEEPTIKPYQEDRWAELDDARTAPVEVSLALLDSLHARWVLLLRSLSATDWSRTFRHPELGLLTLERNLALYAWHGRHHVAHVTALRERMGW
jgi:hypothetical protein